jgi:cysteinyl-tRNA synthetase
VKLDAEDIETIFACLVVVRNLCRKAEEYEEADKIRRTLEHLDFGLEDNKMGTSYFNTEDNPR